MFPGSFFLEQSYLKTHLSHIPHWSKNRIMDHEMDVR